MFSFGEFFRPFFSSVFIALNIDSNTCFIKILRIKKNTLIEEVDREFKIIGNELPIEVVKFIKSYKRRYPFSYVGTISKTYNQGVFPTKKIDFLDKLGIEVRECKTLKIKDWSVFIKKNEIIDIQKYFSRFGGMDYIFSPFVMMYAFIEKNLDDQFRLYVLYEKSNIALIVANEDSVYFGGYFMVESEAEQMNDSVFLQADQNDDMYALDEFEDLDLDFIQDEDKELELDMTKDASRAVSDITKASVIANIIQNSLSEFYTNDFYDEGFAQEVVFLDSIGMPQEILSYIQETTLLDVKRQQFVFQEEVLVMMQKEFGERR